jgi:isopropylmalate/homocitrate/citramalate synthase
VPLSGLIASLCRDEGTRDLIKEKYDLNVLYPMTKRLAEILGIPIPMNIPLVSPGAFTHVAGVHADAQEKDGNTYRNLNPEDFGRAYSVCCASAVVGKSSILHRLLEIGVTLDEGKAKEIADSVREMAKVQGGITVAEVDSLISHVCQS